MAKPILIQIVGDAKSFVSALGDVEQKLGSFGIKGEASFAAVAGAAGTLAVSAGVALFKMGQSVDDAFDRIQIQTGASGDVLAAFESTVSRIATTTPSSFGDIADAVAGLAQRLDLTGAPLEALATQILNLSHITGTDLDTNILAITGLFNNWAVATGDQAGKLDELFRASQETGVAVSDLASTMAQNGAVLRDAGFSFEGAAAFIADLGRRGVEASTVLTGLRTAISNVTAEHVRSQQAQAQAAQAAADRVVAAAERRRAAEERLAQIEKDNARAAETAAKALADASADAADVEADAAKDVARAKEDAAKLIDKVQKPVNNGAVAMADYQKRLAEAQQEAAEKVADAEDAAAKRRKDAAKRVADSQERVTQVAEDSADRVAQANQQAADANTRANARVRSSSAATSAALAKDGESTSDSIGRVIAKIQELGPGAEAQGLAIELFGGRAGEQLYTALTTGGDGVDSLRKKLEDGTGTINGAAAKTEDFGESWQRLKNILITELEPAATFVFDSISTGLEDIVEYFPVGAAIVSDTVTRLFGDFRTGLSEIKGFFEDLWRTVAGAPGWFGDLIGGFVGRVGSPGGGHAAGGQILSSGWTTIDERSSSGAENVWLPQGAYVQPSWSSGGGGGGDTFNVYGSNVSAPELAREIAWQRRRGDGR